MFWLRSSLSLSLSQSFFYHHIFLFPAPVSSSYVWDSFRTHITSSRPLFCHCFVFFLLCSLYSFQNAPDMLTNTHTLYIQHIYRIHLLHIPTVLLGWPALGTPLWLLLLSSSCLGTVWGRLVGGRLLVLLGRGFGSRVRGLRGRQVPRSTG